MNLTNRRYNITEDAVMNAMRTSSNPALKLEADARSLWGLETLRQAQRRDLGTAGVLGFNMHLEAMRCVVAEMALAEREQLDRDGFTPEQKRRCHARFLELLARGLAGEFERIGKQRGGRR